MSENGNIEEKPADENLSAKGPSESSGGPARQSQSGGQEEPDTTRTQSIEETETSPQDSDPDQEDAPSSAPSTEGTEEEAGEGTVLEGAPDDDPEEEPEEVLDSFQSLPENEGLEGEDTEIEQAVLILPEKESPEITDLEGDASEADLGDAATLDDGGDSAVRGDGWSYEGGSFTVERQDGLEGDFSVDGVEVQINGGAGIVVGGSVTVNGKQIGTVDQDGQGSNDLVISLMDGAIHFDIQDLIQNLQFSSSESGTDNNGGQISHTVNGGAGDDTVNGNQGDDVVSGGDGDDKINGGQGDDTLFGGPGDDTLSGDRGNDLLTGGEGADIFCFGLGFGQDTITDFNGLEGDRIDIKPDDLVYESEQTEAGLVLTLEDGATLTLQGVDSLEEDWIV